MRVICSSVSGRAGIFFLDELLDPALEDQQRSVAALQGRCTLSLEEIAQLEHALRSVRIFTGNRAADGGRMHADFFGDLLDHHRLQLVDALFEEILLPGDDGVADLGDGLLALLDVLDQLDGALVALFDVVAGVFVVARRWSAGACRPGSGAASGTSSSFIITSHSSPCLMKATSGSIRRGWILL